MSAALALATEPRVDQEMLWVGPEGKDQAWVLVRARTSASAITVEVSTQTELFVSACCTGRAVWMTRVVDGWIEQRCECFIVSCSGDSATIALRAAGSAVRLDDDLGCVPRT